MTYLGLDTEIRNLAQRLYIKMVGRGVTYPFEEGGGILEEMGLFEGVTLNYFDLPWRLIEGSCITDAGGLLEGYGINYFPLRNKWEREV